VATDLLSGRAAFTRHEVFSNNPILIRIFKKKKQIKKDELLELEQLLLVFVDWNVFVVVFVVLWERNLSREYPDIYVIQMVLNLKLIYNKKEKRNVLRLVEQRKLFQRHKNKKRPFYPTK
jgi:hypothetical protein